jgi:hypothetical protein
MSCLVLCKSASRISEIIQRMSKKYGIYLYCECYVESVHIVHILIIIYMKLVNL